jgi:hypothetical protein
MNVIPKENLINLEGLTREQVTVLFESVTMKMENTEEVREAIVLSDIAFKLSEYLLNTTT